MKYVVVAVEYFTKWIDAKALSNITVKTITKFFWQQIICRFGVPREVIVDNDKQFDCKEFREYCMTIGTKAKFASVYHPQSNGAVERVNGLIFSSTRKCLSDCQRKGKWVEELPKVVWAHNTSISRATKFAPFKLLYREEVMCPEEILHQGFEFNKKHPRAAKLLTRT